MLRPAFLGSLGYWDLILFNIRVDACYASCKNNFLVLCNVRITGHEDNLQRFVLREVRVSSRWCLQTGKMRCCWTSGVSISVPESLTCVTDANQKSLFEGSACAGFLIPEMCNRLILSHATLGDTLLICRFTPVLDPAVYWLESVAEY